MDQAEINQVTRDLTSDDPEVKARAVEKVTRAGDIARAKGMAVDLADKSLSNKYVIVRRTVTVTAAIPAEDYGTGGTEKHDRRLMTEAEIVDFEKGMPKEDQVQNLAEMWETARSEDLIDVQVDVEFLQKSPGR